MCGRYVLKRQDLEALMAQLGVKDPRDFVSRYNIAPTTVVPAIRVGSDGTREAAALRWGLVPAWAKDAAGAPLANARAEGLADRPAFRDAFRRRRCVLPASGFYEWETRGRVKLPQYFQLAGETPCLLAGLWETWRSVDGVEFQSCTIVTTRANAVVAAFHDRMPVILPPAAVARWLDPAVTAPAALEPLLVPAAAPMSVRAVSPRVNSVRHDGPENLAPPPATDAGPQLALGLD